MFEKAYDPKKYEKKLYQQWEESGFFKPDMSSDKDPFVISMPPPNATGTLHLGHAIFLTIQDILVRYHRMKGQPTLWLPGTDHAAIATQSVVEKKLQNEGMKQPRVELGREGLLKEIKKFVEGSKEIIHEQIREIGSSCDWSHEKYTLDADLHKAVNAFFQAMYEDGLIYRGGRLVNWDPHMHTTVADDEVEYIEKKSKFYYFQYGPVVIGTARPETKFLDKVIVVHPDDKRYKDIVGKEFDVEWIEGTIKARVIADECIDMEMGTGAMTITPAHSLVDFELAEKFDLDVEQIIDFDGNIRDDVSEEFGGMPILEARKKIVKRLDGKGLLVKIDDQYENKVAVNYRGKGIIEPQVMKQWFIDVNKKAIDWKGKKRSIKEVMLDAVKSEMIEIIPERFDKIYFHWIENLRDWCISRQIWWGHQVPVWYKLTKEQYQAFTAEPIATSFMLEVLGVDGEVHLGDEKPAGDFWVRDPDTLDTWFSSALWTFSTLGWPEHTEELKKFHPTSVLETGYDIIFFWVARMILASTYCLRRDGLPEGKCIPFKKVYLHGLIRDINGKKMSKSKPETCIDPLDMIEKYGADALRLSLVIGSSPGNDMRLYEEKIAGYRNYVNKVWNVVRFIDSYLEQESTERYVTVAEIEAELMHSDLHMPGIVMLKKLRNLIEHCTEELDGYSIAMPGESTYEFLWSTFADWYIEISKVDPYPVVLQYIMVTLLKLMHPYMPYATEALWQECGMKGLIIAEKWPTTEMIDKKLSTYKDLKKFDQEFSLIKNIVTEVRKIRADYGIAFKHDLSLLINEHKANKELIEDSKKLFKHLANIEEVAFVSDAPAEKALHFFTDDMDCFVPIEGLVDIEKEKVDTEAEIKRLEGWITQLDRKLGNKGFVDNAPADVIDKERQKQTDAEKKLESLRERLSMLS